MAMQMPAADAALHAGFQAKLSRWDLTRRGGHACQQPEGAAQRLQMEGGDDDDHDAAHHTHNTRGGTAGALTPLEKQVQALKAAHPGVVLVVEVGYKYHLYGTPDAEVASKVCTHAVQPNCIAYAHMPLARGWFVI
jgi:hypothetical protein